jgi:hypothetical protein
MLLHFFTVAGGAQSRFGIISKLTIKMLVGYVVSSMLDYSLGLT